jgi:hypothetical protein
MNKETTFIIGLNLTHEAEAFLGPWRPIKRDEIVDPEHVSTTDEGVEIVPTRIYDKPTPHDFYTSQIFAADD